jgi:hypothetical protein
MRFLPFVFEVFLKTRGFDGLSWARGGLLAFLPCFPLFLVYTTVRLIWKDWPGPEEVEAPESHQEDGWALGKVVARRSLSTSELKDCPSRLDLGLLFMHQLEVCRLSWDCLYGRFLSWLSFFITS